MGCILGREMKPIIWSPMLREIVNLWPFRQNEGSMALWRVLDNDTNVKSDYYLLRVVSL